MINIGIIGSEGRMGKALAAVLAEEQTAMRLVGGVDKVPAAQASASVADLAQASEVLIDFSSPVALPMVLDAAVRSATPLVVGTTGLQRDHHQLIDKAAQDIAVLQSGNFSLGIVLLARLVREAAARLDSDWDIEILDIHHRGKVDAPSGTAHMLGEAAAAGRGIALADNSERARDGIGTVRQSGAIGFAALRGGTIAGDHTVIFAGPEEVLTLAHHAASRAIFARGALKAAQWLVAQNAGRYDMAAMLDSL